MVLVCNSLHSKDLEPALALGACLSTVCESDAPKTPQTPENGGNTAVAEPPAKSRTEPSKPKFDQLPPYRVLLHNDDVNDNRTPQLAAIAYDRNENGESATTLFGLDVTTRSLVRIGSRNGSPDAPDTGRLFTLGQLPVSFTLNSGFDIEPEGDTAYAALSGSGSGSVLYRIDLDDGSADRVDVIDEGNQTVISLTIGPEDAADSN